MENLQDQNELNRILRAEKLALRRDAAKADKLKNQKHVKKIYISLKYNPTGSCTGRCKVIYQDHTITEKKYIAKGYGYDKYSALVALIFNDFLIYKLYENRNWENTPYAIINDKVKYYGSGGVGVHSLAQAAEFIGGKLEYCITHGGIIFYEYIDN